MAQFDVFPNPSTASRAHYPLLVDVQHANAAASGTRLVMPLEDIRALRATSTRASPLINVNGQSYKLMPNLTAPLAVSLLRTPVGSVLSQRDAIIGAMDVMLTGS